MRLLAVCAAIAMSSFQASAHEIRAPDGTRVDYSDLQVPGKAASCCEDTHCRPVQDRWNGERGAFDIRIGDEWIPVPAGSVLPSTSPDGRFHVCIWGGHIQCVWTPAMGS